MAKRHDIEGPIHRSILQYLQLTLGRSAVIHHSPNELNLSGVAVQKAIAQNKAKALGMVTGWPDLEIITGGRVYFMEVKGPRGVHSVKQRDVQERLEGCGAGYAVVRNIDDAEDALKRWGLK